MSFDPVLADIRFGCGLSPQVPRPTGVAQMLDGLVAPDVMADRVPIETFDTFLGRMQERVALSQTRRQNRGSEEAQAALKGIRRLNQEARKDHLKWMAASMVRRVQSPTPFRERLEGFWADHFTATGKQGVLRRGASPFVESAVRPNVAGRFENLLIAAVTHPLMVHYLDQERSTGPNSVVGQRTNGKFGLNENLAREILELHTLGVGGPYTQTDVRELAELLTGLTINVNRGRHFRKDLAEPGAETVLGRSYGGDKPNIRDIEEVLRDLARHAVTAQHISEKLAVHFVSDRPDPAIAQAMTAAWLDTDGDLSAVYRAMLDHPAAWQPEGANVKQPFDFLTSACRALAVAPEALIDLEEMPFRLRIHEPMRLMGHIWQKPAGPDGLDEADSAWITPQGLAARLQWAVTVPQLLMPRLPDPREFVQTALGPRPPEAVRFAADAAESVPEGIGLVLASPAFQRM